MMVADSIVMDKLMQRLARGTDVSRIAEEIGIDHSLAQALWSTGVPEAKVLATMVADPKRMSEEEVTDWARGLDDADLARRYAHLIARTPWAIEKTVKWTMAEKEYLKQAGYHLLSKTAKTGPSDVLLEYVETMEQ
jgi:3-methyladenine DNA glycosylase AlkD